MFLFYLAFKQQMDLLKKEQLLKCVCFFYFKKSVESDRTLGVNGQLLKNNIFITAHKKR